MSRFADLVKSAFAPIAMEWFGDPVEYRVVDLDVDADGIQITRAIVGDEVEKRRRRDDEIEVVQIRQMIIVVDVDTVNFSGVESPHENDLVLITELGEVRTYVVESVTGPTGGMSELQLLRIDRVSLGSRQALGE